MINDYINLENKIPEFSTWTRKMLRVIHSDDQEQGAENPNPTGGTMNNEKCFFSRQTNFCKGGG